MKPFIRLYSLCSGYYFYDVGKNCIFSVSEDVYQCLQEFCKYGFQYIATKYATQNEKPFNTVKKLLSLGYLSDARPQKIIHPYTEYVEEYLSKDLNNLLLQVTQMCNFRCDYCPYSGDGILDRSHQPKFMNYETAKAAVDMLINNSQNSDEITIGFYGGEPLLAFNLIREIVCYAEQNAPNKKLNFGITTNGYLMNDDIIEFLHLHKFSVVISFDGPKYIHDKNRRLAIDGTGTYERVYSNMILMKEKGLTFGINAVWDTEEAFSKIIDFFDKDKLFEHVNINIEQVLTGRISTGYNADPTSEYQEEVYTVKAYLDYVGAYKSEVCDDYAYVIKPYELIQKQLQEREKMPKNFHHGGPCIAGHLRLFVDTDGNFFPCEKISGNSKVMRIGTIKTGFDFEHIKNILNIGKITEEECKNCWAMNLCGICGMWADTNETCFCKKSKLNRCDFIKSIVDKNIINYIILSEIKTMLNK